MGSRSSALREDFSGPSTSTPGLGDLPEGCAAEVMMYLEPRDICKLARLNKAFRGASLADFVWESKLPLNYRPLVDKVFDEMPVGISKKDIYAQLCRTNSIDDGTKKVWLDKNTGGICMAISPKGLTITGIDDRRYWNHIPSDESRWSLNSNCSRHFRPEILHIFSSVAYLQHIWWFEINGEVDFPFPAGKYSIFFWVQLGRTVKRFGIRQCNSDNIHGWDKKPVQFELSTSDGQRAISQRFLEEPGKWVRYHVGDFVVKPRRPMKLKFSMAQIDCTHTKGGLCLDSVVICPLGSKCD